MILFISKLMTIFFYLSKDSRRSPDDTNDHSYEFVVKISFISVYLKHSHSFLFHFIFTVFHYSMYHYKV